MKVRQYVYLGVRSELLDPGIISQRLSLIPSQTKLMGSRHLGPPPIPRCHLWQLDSGVESRELPLDDHFRSLLTRLGDSAIRVRDLVRDDLATATIEVVRHFEAGPEDRHISEPGRRVGDLERLRGQHPLVGFGIEPGLLAYAALAGIAFEFDEYADEDE